MISQISLILASASPRRRELLLTSGIQPIVKPSCIEEIRRTDESPIGYCQRLAREKAQAIAQSENKQQMLILAADTVVYVNDDIYEKPQNDQHAFDMLNFLSKDWHHVVSAWYLCSVKQDFVRTGHSISDVRFRSLTEDEIWSYIHTGEGKDKAGSYGIQGLGAALVEEIRGSYSNIVGLPLAHVLQSIRAYYP